MLRISLLEATVEKCLREHGEVGKKIYDDLIVPNVKLLAQFCTNVEIDEHDDELCGWSGLGTCPVCGNEVGRIM